MAAPVRPYRTKHAEGRAENLLISIAHNCLLWVTFTCAWRGLPNPDSKKIFTTGIPFPIRVNQRLQISLDIDYLVANATIGT